MKKDFYTSLSENDKFCCALGKVMLAASKLEVELKQYLRLHGKEVAERRATLGNLIELLKENGHLTTNGEIHFSQINIQRNYLIHNLYGSFVGEIQDWKLPVEGLVLEDIEVYIEKTELTAHNLSIYSKIVSSALQKQDAAKASPLL